MALPTASATPPPAPPPLRAPTGPSRPVQPQQPSFYAPPSKSTADQPALAFAEQAQRYNSLFQGILDRVTPYSAYRWLGTAGLLVLFALRVVFGQGWYIVAYGLSIFLLNIFLAFLQPRFDPSLEQDIQEQDIEEGGEGGAPQTLSSDLNLGLGSKVLGMFGVNGAAPRNEFGEEEFRPFIRRLPEFKFWLQATRATLISLFLTLTRASDIPVYWPILLVYFITLFGLTMRRQIAHMVKFKYVPFDIGRKKAYGGGKK